MLSARKLATSLLIARCLMFQSDVPRPIFMKKCPDTRDYKCVVKAKTRKFMIDIEKRKKVNIKKVHCVMFLV